MSAQPRVAPRVEATISRPAPLPASPEPASVSPEPVELTPPAAEPVWPDDAAEAAFLAEARERGEVVRPVAASEPVEESDPKELPRLDELVNRIPAEVRDALEDLFRAKFVKVQRIPKRALKPTPGYSTHSEPTSGRPVTGSPGT